MRIRNKCYKMKALKEKQKPHVIVYSYCMGLREIAFLLSPSTPTISLGFTSGNS
jgi:hypothetical protein